MIVHLDLEVAGTLSLDAVGADVWSKHPNTTPILIGFCLDNDPVTVIRCTGDFAAGNDACDLIHAILQGAEVHAWNAPFERTVWNNLLTKHGFPPLPLECFHCTMARAANAGLPMNLEAAALAVGSPHQKDKSGNLLMKRMARPRALRADGTPRWWHTEDPNKLLRLEVYNIADVEAERDIAKLIPRMSQRERQIWLVDQRMNERGMPVDKELLGALSALTLEEALRINGEIARITKDAVSSSTQTGRLLGWLIGRGYPHDNLRKDTLSGFIQTPEFYDLDQDAQDVLVLRAEAAKTSTAKINAVANFSQADGRARNLVQYAGAVRTLRWAGRGPQIQNFPRPVIDDVPSAINCVLRGLDGDGLRLLFGKPLDVVSSCLRGLFKAPVGYAFVVCDYHAIEAVVLAWLSNSTELLKVFRQKQDIYVHTAQSVGSTNRTLGKVLRLACGYGMGPAKFQSTAAGYGLELGLKEAADAVYAFRQSNIPIVTLWRGYEESAKAAILNPGKTIDAGKVTFRMADPNGRVAGSLLIEKPSGGTLVYREARIDDGRVSFQGVHQLTRQWTKIDTYGGKLVENVTQAVARDLIADAMVVFEATAPGMLVATIHDEIVALVPVDRAVADFAFLRNIMSAAPSWAPGLPLSAAGYTSARYAKA